MFNITQLVGIPHLGVLSSLDRLIEVFGEAASIKGQKAPVVSIYLKSGQYIQGYLISYNSGPEKKAVLVANYRASQEAAQDLTYVFVDEIAGITVHEADSVVDQLSSGQINLSLKQTPSLSEIQAHLQNFTKEFNQQITAKVSAEISAVALKVQKKNELEALYFSVVDWTRAMRKHASDEIIQQTFKDATFKFVFTFGPIPQVSSEDGNVIKIISTITGDNVERVSRFVIESKLREFV